MKTCHPVEGLFPENLPDANWQKRDPLAMQLREAGGQLLAEPFWRVCWSLVTLAGSWGEVGCYASLQVTLFQDLKINFQHACVCVCSGKGT